MILEPSTFRSKTVTRFGNYKTFSSKNGFGFWTTPEALTCKLIIERIRKRKPQNFVKLKRAFEPQKKTFFEIEHALQLSTWDTIGSIPHEEELLKVNW